jgi:hypothetical protein
MSAQSLQLYSSRADRLVSALKANGSRLPFVRPAPTVCSDFSKVRLRFQPSTALPPNCNIPFTARITLPLYSIATNLFLALSVAPMPANVTVMQWGPLLALDSIQMLAANGRVVWESRPSQDAFVKISQCWPREGRRTAQAMLGASASDQTANRTSETTYYIPLVDFMWNNLTGTSAAIDLRSLAPSIQFQFKFRSSDQWCYASGTGGTPGVGVQVTSVELHGDYMDLPSSALSSLVSTYVPKSILGRAYEYQSFPWPGSSATGSQPFVCNLTGLSAPCVNLFCYIISAAEGVDGAQTTPLTYDKYSLSASGVQIVDSMTQQENALELWRLFGTSPYGSDISDSNANIITYSFALPGYATNTSDACGALSMRNTVNPQLTIWSSASLDEDRTVIVISEVYSVLSYSGSYGAMQITQSTDAL